jgi:hypothetical protein
MPAPQEGPALVRQCNAVVTTPWSAIASGKTLNARIFGPAAIAAAIPWFRGLRVNWCRLAQPPERFEPSVSWPV